MTTLFNGGGGGGISVIGFGGKDGLWTGTLYLHGWAEFNQNVTATEDAKNFVVVPRDCIISKMYSRIRWTVPGGASTITFTVRKNAVDQILSTTHDLLGGAGETQKSDLVNSFSCVAGDRLSVKGTLTGIQTAVDVVVSLDAEWA
jgi:hypothetical protein